MEFRQLRYFIAVAKHLNFSRAAGSLYITQSTLSQQISNLEKELGVQLLVRDKHSVELTEAGKRFLHGARQMVIEADLLIGETRRDLDNNGSRWFRVVFEEQLMSNEYERLRMLALLGRMRDRCPDVEISIRSVPEEQSHRLLMSGNIEASISHALATEEPVRFCMKQLSIDKVYLCTAIQEDLTVAEKLAKVPSIFVGEKIGPPTNEIMRLLSSFDVYPEIRYVDNIMEGILYSELGYGGIILPEGVLSTFGKGHLCCDAINEPSLDKPIVVEWLRDNSNPYLQVFLEELDR